MPIIVSDKKINLPDVIKVTVNRTSELFKINK